MRRIALIIALLATAACSASPTAPELSARFDGGLMGSGGRTEDSGGGAPGSGTESDDGAPTGGPTSTASAPFIGSDAREGETASAAGQIVGSGG